MTRSFRTTAEFARELHTDAHTVCILIRRGELEAMPKYPNRKRPTYLISDEAVARYYAAREREQGAA